MAVVGLAVAGMAIGREASQRAVLVAPAATPLLYDRNGTFLTQIGHQHADGDGETRVDYGFWTVDGLPERVVQATLALEDRRFWEHPGVDPLALGRAAWQNLTRGRRVSGASTIAMQVARMQNPAPRTLWSKAVEAGTALLLTARYDRETILRHYLRLVPYGNGSHGIAHAARWYLDKPVADLSWAEIALLASVPQSPTVMNPLRGDGLAKAKQRGRRVLDTLAQHGVVPEPHLAVARRQLSGLKPLRPPRRPDALHAVLRLSDTLKGQLPPGVTPSDPRIRTTLDLPVQQAVATIARRQLAGWRSAGAEQTAVMVVERGSRSVLASLGSSDYGDRHSGAIDFTRNQRSPGSTLKPFIYALALERGRLKPSDVMADLPEGASGIGNADGAFLGPMLPRQALANSRNVPATNLLRELGLETTFRALRDLGLHDLEVPAESFGLSMAIGSLPTTLDRLMRAYGALAEDGVVADLGWVQGAPRPAGRRVFSQDTARLVTLFLADPLARLPSFPRFGPSEYPFPVALKTGTSQGYRDAWVIAWSGRYMVGVWVGRGDAGTMSQLSGARTAARLAHAVLLRLHGTTPGDLADSGFAPPQDRVPVELCVYGGKRSVGGCGQTLTEWVRPSEMPAIEEAAVLRTGVEGTRLELAMAPAHRAWARSEGYPLVETAAAASGAPVRLSISTPEEESRIWRNPEVPAGLQKLALKAVVEPRVPEVVWYVDGRPFAVADPDVPVFWPVQPGLHRFQLRLPGRPETSRTIKVVIE